eukprot:TRINITY_DN1924_c0_g1_i1.p1 TRINITY_DN1924_c0_g1~~TRINITY_DN1924_c0_g1_i1.p1  ORF type:complete len:332 (-),score=57.38 TRINITY_DN1924_c0_g1_i1:81-1076(-)
MAIAEASLNGAFKIHWIDSTKLYICNYRSYERVCRTSLVFPRCTVNNPNQAVSTNPPRTFTIVGGQFYQFGDNVHIIRDKAFKGFAYVRVCEAYTTSVMYLCMLGHTPYDLARDKTGCLPVTQQRCNPAALFPDDPALPQGRPNFPLRPEDLIFTGLARQNAFVSNSEKSVCAKRRKRTRAADMSDAYTEASHGKRQCEESYEVLSIEAVVQEGILTTYYSQISAAPFTASAAPFTASAAPFTASADILPTMDAEPELMPDNPMQDGLFEALLPYNADGLVQATALPLPAAFSEVAQDQQLKVADPLAQDVFFELMRDATFADVFQALLDA